MAKGRNERTQGKDLLSPEAKDVSVEEESAGDEVEIDTFNRELERSLAETEKQVLELARGSATETGQSWLKARDIVEQFQPVPWFIWRISNFVFSTPGTINKLSEGAVYGLHRLLFAAAADRFIGAGREVTNVHRAFEIVPSDVFAAVCVVHAVCRRLSNCQHERIWRPIMDDALLRCEIGYLVGERVPTFGAGRGMLAGFAGRCGLAILIACGTLDQARKALELLAGGSEIKNVGLNVYGCDPLQVSAMTLSAAGCGRDAAFGTVRYASPEAMLLTENQEQFQWLSAFTVVEKVRIGREREVDERYWEALGFVLGQDRGDLVEVAESLARKGHSFSWII